MDTIKLGSRGENVKSLQKILGINPCDGICGNKTVAAIRAFQIQHGLVGDGIAGQATLRALGLAGNTSVVTKRKPLTFSTTLCLNRKIKYIVIHFTAGSHSREGRALSCYDVWKQNKSASADFAVDDVDIVQFNTDIANRFCWAVGGRNYGNSGGSLFCRATNANCINIELCSTCSPSTSQAVSTANHRGWSFTEATLNNALRLTRELMRIYNIDKAHVIRHYDVTGKLCPGIYGWNDEPLVDATGKRTGVTNNSELWQSWKDKL